MNKNVSNTFKIQLKMLHEHKIEYICSWNLVFSSKSFGNIDHSSLKWVHCTVLFEASQILRVAVHAEYHMVCMASIEEGVKHSREVEKNSDLDCFTETEQKNSVVWTTGWRIRLTKPIILVAMLGYLTIECSFLNKGSCKPYAIIDISPTHNTIR